MTAKRPMDLDLIQVRKRVGGGADVKSLDIKIFFPGAPLHTTSKSFFDTHFFNFTSDFTSIFFLSHDTTFCLIQTPIQVLEVGICTFCVAEGRARKFGQFRVSFGWCSPILGCPVYLIDRISGDFDLTKPRLDLTSKFFIFQNLHLTWHRNFLPQSAIFSTWHPTSHLHPPPRIRTHLGNHFDPYADISDVKCSKVTTSWNICVFTGSKSDQNLQMLLKN